MEHGALGVEQEASPPESGAGHSPGTAVRRPECPSESLTPRERLARIRLLRRLPVTVSVRLAEKKVEMTALLGLTPGSLITFNKSCEDLLDLYVNNQLYCRGEAVKVGEKFGLKINEVGAKPVQEEHVFNW